MRQQPHSPDELRAYIANEVEEIRNELDQLRTRVEAQQASLSITGASGIISDPEASTDIRSR